MPLLEDSARTGVRPNSGPASGMADHALAQWMCLHGNPLAVKGVEAETVVLGVRGFSGDLMLASVVRGVGSVLTVVIAILLTTRAGETGATKVLAAVISAAVLISLEWFVRWSPRHLQWARRHLDERSVWTGVWVQTVKEAWSAAGKEADNRNSFSVFRVLYGEKAYFLAGRAYDNDGNEVAEWESTEGATFSRDGRRLSYLWRGKSWGVGGSDPARTGLATMQLRPGEKDYATGEVQHVGINRQLHVELERVTTAFLHDKGLADAFTLPALEGDGERRRFANALTRTRRASNS